MKSADEDSSASFITAGPPRLIQRTGDVGILLDELIFLHHQKRKESHAARALGNPDFVLLRARAAGSEQRTQRSQRIFVQTHTLESIRATSVSSSIFQHSSIAFSTCAAGSAATA